MRYDLSKSSKYPLMYFEAYDKVEKYIPQFPDRNAGILIKPKISKDEYFRSIEYIKRQIYNGITYEVNYTYPSEIRTILVILNCMNGYYLVKKHHIMLFYK